VEDVVEVELAVFTVFEPFLGGLVSADVEVPGYFGNVGEVLGFVDVDFVFVIVDFADFVCSVDGVLGDVVVYYRDFLEVDLNKWELLSLSHLKFTSFSVKGFFSIIFVIIKTFGYENG
jgi:hypothetical protein